MKEYTFQKATGWVKVVVVAKNWFDAWGQLVTIIKNYDSNEWQCIEAQPV